jgi:hypothetical protein
MKSFFNKKTLLKIKKLDDKPGIIKNFLTKKESKEILKHIKNLKNKNFGGSVYVNRSDAKKMYFDFDKNKLLKELKKKLEKKFGKFYFNHIAPQLLISKFPVRLHADTGKNPDDVIFKNMIIVLDIKYKNKNKKKPPNTIIFGNRWYGKSTLFSRKQIKTTDHIVKDVNKKFIDILDVADFYEKIKNANNKAIKYKNNKFLINNHLIKEIRTLLKTKRINQRSNRYITKGKKMDKKFYNNYLSHLDYRDCDDLKDPVVFSWEIGDLMYWSRTNIHCSDNYLKNNVESKTFLTFFTSKNKVN